MRLATVWLVFVCGVAATSHDQQAAVVVFVSTFDVYRVDASGAVELEPTGSFSAHSALSSAAKQAVVEVMGLRLVSDPELTQSHFERLLDDEGNVLSREHVLHYLEQLSGSQSESSR